MLVVEGLHAGYGAAEVLLGVDMRVESGEAVGLVGANGAGKTTLVRSLAGLLQAARGRITLDRQELTGLPAHKRHHGGLAVVLENRHLFGDLTVRQNLGLAQRNADDGRPVYFSFDELLDLFPVVRQKIDTPVSLLSGGQQQMVAIARALLLQPRVLVLDEPSTGLSPRAVSEVLGVLGALRARGTSIVLVEQSLAIASQATDRGYVMSLGRMVRQIGKGGWPAFLADPDAVNAYLGG